MNCGCECGTYYSTPSSANVFLFKPWRPKQPGTKRDIGWGLFLQVKVIARLFQCFFCCRKVFHRIAYFSCFDLEMTLS